MKTCVDYQDSNLYFQRVIFWSELHPESYFYLRFYGQYLNISWSLVPNIRTKKSAAFYVVIILKTILISKLSEYAPRNGTKKNICLRFHLLFEY